MEGKWRRKRPSRDFALGTNVPRRNDKKRLNSGKKQTSGGQMSPVGRTSVQNFLCTPVKRKTRRRASVQRQSNVSPNVSQTVERL